jgi:hypothetical protein
MINEYYKGYPRKKKKINENLFTESDILDQVKEDMKHLKIECNRKILENEMITDNDFNSTYDSGLIDDSFELDSLIFYQREMTKEEINNKIIKNAIESEKTFIKKFEYNKQPNDK